ncbi:7799_t:CDS:2, partial [Cetraspora pellucida]
MSMNSNIVKPYLLLKNKIPTHNNQSVKQNVISSTLKELNGSQTNSKSSSYRSLAKKYGIPETTLRCAIKNGGLSGHLGPVKVLTDYEEQQLVEISFIHLKQAYSKSCKQLHFNNNDELVTKHIFAKVLSPAYIKTYTPVAISTEQFDVSPMQPSTPILYLQPSTSTSLPSQAFSNLDPNLILTYTKKRSLKAEVELFNFRVDQLEAELKTTKDELETFKNPGIYLLCLVLKYPLPHTLQAVEDPDQAVNQPEA